MPRIGASGARRQANLDNFTEANTLEDLETALVHDQFVLHYQPKIDVRSGATVGAEALVRWQHPTRGLLFPDAFLPVVERSGRMGALTELVLTTAVGQLATWRAAGLAITVAVNLSASDLLDLGLVERIAALLAEHEVPVGSLELEITESVLMTDPQRARAVLEQLRGLGLRIAVDDYGTGYSALAYLRDLPVDELKIDRSFIADFTADRRSVAIVRSTIELAHALELKVVAEGVEHQHDLDALAAFGCDFAQGYHFSAPLPADAFAAWARALDSATDSHASPRQSAPSSAGSMTDPRFHDLLELSRRVTSSLDLLTVGADLVSGAISATGASTAAIALWDRERDVLVTLTDIEVVELGSTMPSGELYARLEEYPATRQVLTSRRAINIHVDRGADDAAEQSWLREYGLSALLILPLVSRGEAIGVMEIARVGGPFSDDDLVYCQLLSDIAGSAVDNAQLHGELESTLAQYRLLIERLPAVTYLDDLETGETQFVSPQIVDLFGITPAEWMADPEAWLRPVHPDDRDRVRDAFLASMQAREPLRVEYRVVSADGVIRWVVDHAVVLPQVEGRRLLTQGVIFDISDRKRAEQELAHRANHDPLTGLPNRDQFRSRLDDAITYARGSGRSLAVLYVDLDGFKRVNDSHGHDAGDELLAASAERLRGASRAGDIVGRDGGDEFLVLMADLPGDEAQATRAAEDAVARVCRALRQPLLLGDVELDIGASVGISLFPFDAGDAQTLLKHADAAMYEAKAAGRDAAHVYLA